MSAHTAVDLNNLALLACELPRWRKARRIKLHVVEEETDRRAQRRLGRCYFTSRSQADPPQLHKPVGYVPNSETITVHSVEPTFGTAAALSPDPLVKDLLIDHVFDIICGQETPLGKSWCASEREKVTLYSCEQDALALWMSSSHQVDNMLGEMSRPLSRRHGQRPLSPPPADTVDPFDTQYGLDGALREQLAGLDDDEEEELTRCLPSNACHAGYLSELDVGMRGAHANGRFVVPC